MRNSFLIVGIILIRLSNAFAQETPPGGEIEDTQIIIEKDKELTLPSANRIYKRTNVRSISPEKQELEYQITQPTYQFQQYVPRFSFESFDVNTKEITDSGDNFLKAGYGNYNSPLVQGYLGYKKKKSRAGLWINHESFGTGPVREKESAFGFTEVLLSGSFEEDLFFVSPDIYFQREGYYPYGYNPDEISDPDFDYTDRKIGASVVRGSIPVTLTLSEKWDLNLSPEYQLTSMKFQDQDAFNRENLFETDGNLSYAFDEDFVIGLASAFTTLSYKGGIEQTRGIFEANPYVDFKGDDLDFRGGLRFFSATGSNPTKTYLLLDAAASYQLSPGFGVFGEMKGNLEPVTLNNLRLRNRYLDDSLSFLNQEIPIDFRGGLNLGFSEKLQFKPYIRYRLTKNKAVFIHSGQDTSRFVVLYDNSFNEFTIGFENRFLVTPNTSIDLGAKYTSYSPGSIEEAWYLPAFELDLVGSQKVGGKLTLDLTLFVLAGIKAPDPVTTGVIQLDPIGELGIGARYAVTDQIGAFVNFDNLLSQNYERYLNYPVRGFMAKGGFIYRF